LRVTNTVHLGRVIGYREGQSVICEFVNGEQFVLTSKTIPSFPEVGNVITFETLSALRSAESILMPFLLVQNIARIHCSAIWEHWKRIYSMSMMPCYQVNLGKLRVKCRGCKRMIANRSELRITVETILVPIDTVSSNKAPFPGRSSFCFGLQCIERALSRKRLTSNLLSDHLLPDFDGQLGVSIQLLRRIGVDSIEKLPTLEGIQYRVIP